MSWGFKFVGKVSTVGVQVQEYNMGAALIGAAEHTRLLESKEAVLEKLSAMPQDDIVLVEAYANNGSPTVMVQPQVAEEAPSKTVKTVSISNKKAVTDGVAVKTTE